MRLIDADKIDFGKVFIGASDFAKDTREAALEMNEEKYTIEQIIDAIVQADEEIIHAIQHKDREMLEDVLKELSFEKWLESSYFAKKIADALCCNCSGCQSEGTDECMHCMRAYTDCYKAKKQEG